VVPGARYAGLDESTGPGDRLVRTVLGGPGLIERGTTTISGSLWSVRRSARGEIGFVRTAGPLTVVVTGNASDAQLRALVASLAPR
jgi:hypothetical protein